MSDSENVVITNPDNPKQTYTYGKRGRKPNWVMEFEKNNPDLIPQKEEEEKTGPIMGPNGQVWAGRGRKPKWLVEMEKRENDEEEDWKCWRFNGTAQALIVAQNEREALGLINGTLKDPMTLKEFHHHWQRATGDSVDVFIAQEKRVCLEFDNKTEQWVSREKVTKAYDSFIQNAEKQQEND